MLGHFDDMSILGPVEFLAQEDSPTIKTLTIADYRSTDAYMRGRTRFKNISSATRSRKPGRRASKIRRILNLRATHRLAHFPKIGSLVHEKEENCTFPTRRRN